MADHVGGRAAAAGRMAKYLYGLTDEMVEEFKEAFMVYSEDEGESIGTEDVSDVMKILGQILTEVELQQLIREVGPCEDGNVFFGQFLQMMSIKLETTGGQKELKEAFQVFDKNNKRYLTFDELSHAMTSMGEKLSAAEVDDMINEASSTGDGKINYQEFVSIITRRK